MLANLIIGKELQKPSPPGTAPAHLSVSARRALKCEPTVENVGVRLKPGAGAVEKERSPNAQVEDEDTPTRK